MTESSLAGGRGRMQVIGRGSGGEQFRATAGYVFPLLAIVFAAYSMLEFAVGPVQIAKSLELPILEVVVGSGQRLVLHVSDAFVLAIFAMLFGEVLKGAATGVFAFVDQALSIVISVICIYSFLLIAGYGTTVFLYITVATVFDVASHFFIGSRVERHEGAHAAQ